MSPFPVRGYIDLSVWQEHNHNAGKYNKISVILKLEDKLGTKE